MEPIIAIEADPRTGCITSVGYGGGVIRFKSAGCEVGNWHGFFSQARLGGVSVCVEKVQVSIERCRIEAQFTILLPGGHFSLRCIDALRDGELLRTYTVKALANSLLGDWVIRLAVDAQRWPVARVGARPLHHLGCNRMVEDGRDAVVLLGGLHCLRLAPIGEQAGECFQRLGYVRDDPVGDWVIHHRLLAVRERADEYVLRFHRLVWSLPPNSLLLRCKWLDEMLWRRAERQPRSTPFVQLGGNIRLREGECLRLQSLVRLENAPLAADSARAR